MEKSGAATGLELDATHRNGDGERINDSHPRKSGTRPGTFIQTCVICEGKGRLPIHRPSCFPPDSEICLSCDGMGYAVRDGEREGDSDRRTQPTWGDVALFSLVVAFFTAFGCALLYLYVKGR